MTARQLPERILVAFSLAGEQRGLVRDVAEEVENRLGRETVFYDEWFEHDIAGADADLKLQRIYGERSALTVYCVSKEYGAKPWTRTEHAVIRDRVMKARQSADRRVMDSVLPIRVGEGEVEGVLMNTIVPDVRGRSVAQIADLIIARLRLVEPGLPVFDDESPAAPRWPDACPPLRWPMADHGGVRETFAELLTGDVTYRYLPIRGASETGKSHITRQMLANVLAMADIACGRFDFKGTTDMDVEVNAFVQYLGVPPPKPSPRLHDRLAEILNGLMRREHPTLLIFDTYEMAGETQDWVEKQLLFSLVRAPWLRVVIAGQKLPDPITAVWSAVARPTLELVPPPPADWFAYGRQHRPDLTLEFVETACDYVSHKASVLAQLFGPAS